MSQHVDSGVGYLVLGWLGACFAFSAIYRLVRHKPVLFFTVTGADFLERTASGGDARNCLVVAINAGRLIVRPFFPFNLLFLPEIYGLEFDVPLESVLWAQLLPRRPGVWGHLLQGAGRNVRVRIREPGRSPRTFELSLNNPEAFVKLLPAFHPPSSLSSSPEDLPLS